MRGSVVWLLVGLLAAFALTALGVKSVASRGSWMAFLDPELRQTEQRLESLRNELVAMGEPMIGNTVTQLGYHHPQQESPPPTAPWVQVDLGFSQRIDAVVLVPALTDYQPLGGAAFAFPVRFRVDVSDDLGFVDFTPLLIWTDEDFRMPTYGPVAVPASGARARYVRLTVTRLPEVNNSHFFALAEIMVLQGNRNIAVGRGAEASATGGAPNRWALAYLTDGYTPLGPPIRRGDLPSFDALFSIETEEGDPAWMAVDLGVERWVDEVRLHPLHAWQGVDVPGYAFPAGIRLEASLEEEFAQPTVLYDSGEVEFPRPGNNPVVFGFPRIRSRFVRVVATRLDPKAQRLGLSEFEILDEGRVVSYGRRALSSGDRPRSVPRPTSLLTDGRTSFGRLVELSEWIDEWGRRRELEVELLELEERVPVLHKRVAGRVALAGAGLATGVGLLGAVGLMRARRLRNRERDALRTRLAQDLHDEIGSNLAGIAVLAETAALRDGAPSELSEIDRVARETADAMREVLWLVGAKQASGIDLAAHLKLAASRLLPRAEIRWEDPSEQWLNDWPVERRREFFLFFKEALTNVARHARATRVDIALRVVGDRLELELRDNGRGFDAKEIVHGLGLQSLYSRAESLRGTVDIDSSVGVGTTVRLRIPRSTR